MIVGEGIRQTAEVEFNPAHPDVFSTNVAAQTVLGLAREVDKLGDLNSFRADINVQTLGGPQTLQGTTPVRVNIGGQLVLPEGVSLQDVAHDAVISTLARAGYLSDGDFGRDALFLSLDGLTSQSPNLNGTTNKNKFADSAVAYGHYLAEPFGLQGTFPGLILGQRVNNRLVQLTKEHDWLRHDGKVHVTTEFTQDGPVITGVYVSVAHARNVPDNFRNIIKLAIGEEFDGQFGIDTAQIDVNAGGDFNVYFVQADAGVSKVKDGVIVTGGLHQIGTDAIWGKCGYKASAVTLPHAFAVARAICDATGAQFATISAYSEYGRGEIVLQLQDIDPQYECLRRGINNGLQHLPSDRDGIRSAVGLGISLDYYNAYNDVSGFHDSQRPWKKPMPSFEQIIASHL